MPIYALIVNNYVANIIVAEASNAEALFPNAIRIDGMSPTPGIGWHYLNGTFTAPGSEPLQ